MLGGRKSVLFQLKCHINVIKGGKKKYLVIFLKRNKFCRGGGGGGGNAAIHDFYLC